MSALTLFLTTVMVIPGNGPEAVSWEMEEQLDLRGEWKGTFSNSSGSYRVIVTRDKVSLDEDNGSREIMIWRVRDEGKGKVHIDYWMLSYLGIYRQEGDNLIICLRQDSMGRPTCFLVGDGQELLTLHRVKPRK